MASYDVEEILDSRKKGKNTEFLVRWAPSWEVEKNLNCNKLIREFKTRSGEEVNNGDEDEDKDEEDEEAEEAPKRGKPRKAATAGNKKRKTTEKTKKSKRRRR